MNSKPIYEIDADSVMDYRMESCSDINMVIEPINDGKGVILSGSKATLRKFITKCYLLAPGEWRDYV